MSEAISEARRKAGWKPPSEAVWRRSARWFTRVAAWPENSPRQRLWALMEGTGFEEESLEHILHGWLQKRHAMTLTAAARRADWQELVAKFAKEGAADTTAGGGRGRASLARVTPNATLD